MANDEVRKGTVVAMDTHNCMGIDYHDGGGSIPVPRWMFGGLTTGLHIGASQFDQIAVLRWGNMRKPITGVPMTDHPDKLTPLKPGEVLLYGPNNKPLIQANAVTPFQITLNNAVLAIDAAGNLSLVSGLGSVTVDGPLVLTHQVLSGSRVQAGTITGSGTDPQGGTVTVTGTSATTFPRTLSLTVNGSTYIIPSLT